MRHGWLHAKVIGLVVGERTWAEPGGKEKEDEGDGEDEAHEADDETEADDGEGTDEGEEKGERWRCR